MTQQHTPTPWKINRKIATGIETVADGQGINLISDCADPDGSLIQY